MGIDPGYVLDRMEPCEMRALISHRDRRHRDSWEQTRMLSFTMANCAGAKLSEPSVLFRLPWDTERDGAEEERRESQPMTQDDVDRLHALAQSFIENGTI